MPFRFLLIQIIIILIPFIIPVDFYFEKKKIGLETHSFSPAKAESSLKSENILCKFKMFLLIFYMP